jgi:hypothetical protein
MYDGVTASRLPIGAAIVGGYLNGKYAWSAADWARFPNSIKVGISVRASYLVGHVLDVEIGDATPAESVDWVISRRQAGADPTVYCNASTWPSVQDAFLNRGVAEPHYWIAKYDGVPTVPAGAVAKQHTTTAGWDQSVVADYWPGVDSAPNPQPVPAPPGNPDEDDMSTTLSAGNDVNLSIFVKGKTQLYFCVSALGGSKSVSIASIDFYGDTKVGGVGGAYRNIGIDGLKPGPLVIPPNAVMAQIRYTADHEFTVGTA